MLSFYQYFNSKNYIIEAALGHAGVFAANKHEGQFRKMSGAPYITHPMKVVRILQSVGVKDENLLVSAFLHDTLEDTNTSYDELKQEFSSTIADLVKELTSSKEEIKRMGKTEYLSKHMARMSQGALTIKLADRLHNVSDLNTMKPAKATQYAQQTADILKYLRKQGSIQTNPQEKLVSQINKSIIPFL